MSEIPKDMIEVIKGSELPEIVNVDNCTLLAYENVGTTASPRLVTGRADVTKITPLFDVSQTTGQSTTQTMSQKVVTDELVKKAEETTENGTIVREKTDPIYIWGVADKNQTRLIDFDRNAIPYIANLDKSLIGTIGLEQLTKDLQEKFSQTLNTPVKVVSNDLWLFAIVDENKKVLFGINKKGSIYPVKEAIDKSVDSLPIKIISDDIWLLAVVDTEGNILFGINKKGELYPISNLIDSQLKKLDLSNSNGLTGNSLRLAIPEFAYINIIGDTTLMTKDNPVRCIIEYRDSNGISFRSLAEISWQGTSSIAYDKKNYSIDLINEDGSKRKIKFGNWIEIDSFHLKADYVDATRIRNNVSAKIWENMIRTRPYLEQRPWRKPYNKYNSNLADRFETGALGHVDGFPIEVSINGVFEGKYNWNLNKNIANYMMDKANPIHVLLEAQGSSIFTNLEEWEHRNPKSGSDESTQAKLRFSQWASQATIANIKTNAHEYINVNNWIDYYIFINAIFANDNITKNVLFGTYDGLIWSLFPYDLDTTFGLRWNGSTIYNPNIVLFNLPESLLQVFAQAYKTEIRARYAELRNSALSVQSVTDEIINYSQRTGYDLLKRDLEKWSDTPSNITPPSPDDYDSGCLTSTIQMIEFYEKRMTYLINNL